MPRVQTSVTRPRPARATRRAACAFIPTCLWGIGLPAAEPPSVPTVCDVAIPAPFCQAVRGDRSEGWRPQSRSEVIAQNGMVATSQPLAAQAGLQVLMRGGNAIDAAVATAAVLNVVEPMSTGIGGDFFAIVYIAKEKKLYALNASGVAPTGATLGRLHTLGYDRDPKNWGPGSGMPLFGILPVTVPGAVWGWQEILSRFGTRSFKDVLEPAIRYARDGVPISERIASDWRLPDVAAVGSQPTGPDPDSVRAWYVAGKPPAAGTVFRNPDLAHSFELLQQHGAQVFYQGEMARAIIAKSTAMGGTMTGADLASYRGEWGEPSHTRYHGYDVYELPPPSQDWATLEMLNVLQACLPQWGSGQTLATLGPRSALFWHLLVEAKKIAYADLFAYNADPHFSPVPLERLLSSTYANAQCARVDPKAASHAAHSTAALGTGDTVVLATADREGNMVSWVSSNYYEFGSGITVPGYGFILHNRGALFSLDSKSPNAIAPHKRPFNTLSAGFVMREGVPLMTLTLMGGDMQAQGHAQAIVNIVDLGANVQAASDMARFRHLQIPDVLTMESGLYALVGATLTRMGHDVQSVDGADMGGFQSIMVQAPSPASPDQARVYRGGSDHRKDGAVVGW